MDYLNASDALNMLAGRKHRDDGHAAQLLRELQPNDHEILKRAGLTPEQFGEGIDLDDAELLQSAIYQAKQPKSGVQMADLNQQPMGLVEADYQPTPNVRAVLPMNQSYGYGQRLNYNPNVPNDKLNAIASGERTQTTRSNYADTVAIRRLRPEDTVLFYNDKSGEATYGRVTGSGQVDPVIFTGSPETSRQARIDYAAGEGGNINYANQTLFGNESPRIIPLDKPWDKSRAIEFPEGSGKYLHGLPGDAVTLNYASSSPVVNIADLPASHQQMVEQRMNQFVESPRNLPTTGEGYAAYGDNELSWRKNPTAANQGAMPMLSGEDRYDPLTAIWLKANQVNTETKTTPADIRKRQGVKSRWEPFTQTESGLQPVPVGDIPINLQGFFDLTANHPKVEKLRALNNDGNLKWQYIERPITSAIQNLKPGVNSVDVRNAQDWGEDTSKFYQSAITPEMLDRGLPLQRQLQSVDQVLGGINREEAYQQQLGNLESREVYNKPRDLKPPGSEYGNYNLAFKYANVSDQMGLNDAYNQQWGERAPRNYSAYSGGPLRYNDAGVGVGFGDKNLQPNVELAEGARNYLPVSETYTSAPQHTYSEKRNIVPLQPEVADLPAMQKQQELLRQHLAADTPQPSGSMKMTTGNGTYYKPMPFTPGEAIPGVFEQVVDAKGNPVMQDVLDADGKPSMVKQYKGEQLIDVPQQRAMVVPFVPARDPVFRNEQLGNAMVQVGDQLVPYAGSAGVSLGRTELPRDPSIVPDAVEAMQQLERSGRNQLAQGSVNASSPTASSGATRRAYAGAEAAAQQLSSAREAMAALQSVDPTMNVDRQEFDVDVSVRPGVSGNAVYDLMSRHGLNPVASAAGDYDRITGGGELPVGEQVKLAQGLRRTLAPQQMGDTAIADPELAHLRNQWQSERRAVMGKTADQLAAIKELHGQRRLDRVGRPGESTVDVWQSKVNPNTAGIDRLSSAIENANYKGDDMRRNLNFYADDDFAMLGDNVHPFDRAAAARYQPEYIPNPWNGAVEQMPTTVMMEAPTQQSGVRQLPPGRQMEAPSMSSSGSWQAQMAEAMPTSDFDWNPSQAEPAYTGQSRRAPGGAAMHVPQPAANNPWYRTKAGMAGIGGAAALTLGALAYNQMQRKQAEEDLRSQQLMAATGWR